MREECLQFHSFEQDKTEQMFSDIPVSSCSSTGLLRNGPYWTSRENSLEVIELSSRKKLVYFWFPLRAVLLGPVLLGRPTKAYKCGLHN